MKYLSILALILLMGCTEALAMTEIKNDLSGWGCNTREYCYEGVIYIYFCQGFSVKFLSNGKVALCDSTPKSKN